MLKAAVIGIGNMGRNHARIYNELPAVELVGVADVDEEKIQQVSRRMGVQGFSNFRQLLDETKPDLVSIVVPTVHHLNIAHEVIGRGIHLLVEKPIALQITEAQQMINEAKKAGVKLMIGHVERFNPAITALKERLSANELGPVFQIDARRQGPFPTQVQDVGVVIDLAVHDLDIMRYVTGSEIVRVFAETERKINSKNEDMLHGLVRMDSGVMCSLTINWLTPTKIRQIEVIGEKGMFRADYLTQDLFLYENAMADEYEWDTLRVLRGVGEGRMIRYSIPKQEPLYAELESFVNAVLDDTPVSVTGEDGLQALKLAQLLVKSGAENCAVVHEW